MQGNSVFSETAIVYCVEGENSLAVYHEGSSDATLGVLMVVGGRQYRVGAHRQFVLLARALANEGFHVLRFDVRGMGDSGGEVRHFLDTGNDLRFALKELKKQAPGVKRVVVWGLCDGATATIMNVESLPDIQGVMLVNPWVTTDVGSAKVQIKHYYQERLLSVNFWSQLVRGKLDIKASVSSLLSTIRRAVRQSDNSEDISVELPRLVFDRMESFTAATLVVISNSDLTAMEFHDAYTARYNGKNVLPNAVSVIHVDADHTFSGHGQHEKLVSITLDFVVACDQLSFQISTSDGAG